MRSTLLTLLVLAAGTDGLQVRGGIRGRGGVVQLAARRAVALMQTEPPIEQVDGAEKPAEEGTVAEYLVRNRVDENDFMEVR